MPAPQTTAPWITAAIGALLLVPHLVWLWANDFIPMSYAVGVDKLASLGEAAGSDVMVLGGGGGLRRTAVLLVATACRPSPAAVRDMLRPPEPDRRFAATAFCTPLLVPPLVTVAMNLELNPIWSIAGLTLLPVMLIPSPLLSISRNSVRSIVTLAVTLPLLAVVTAPAIAIVTHKMGLPRRPMGGSSQSMLNRSGARAPTGRFGWSAVIWISSRSTCRRSHRRSRSASRNWRHGPRRHASHATASRSSATPPGPTACIKRSIGRLICCGRKVRVRLDIGSCSNSNAASSAGRADRPPT